MLLTLFVVQSYTGKSYPVSVSLSFFSSAPLARIIERMNQPWQAQIFDTILYVLSHTHVV
jgi:hypothetical protein